MDELDTKIIDILQGDGRASNAGMARLVGVSEGTVRRRLKRLVEQGYIEIVALPDPIKLGYESQALVGVQVDPDKVDQVANDLADLAEINWVAITTGSFDIFAWATLQSAEELGLFLRTKVGVISGVRRTETFVNLEKKKRGNGRII
jgi:Lrp/AsnC family transcriptional regulator for asnA, asnC and gidA